MRLSSIEIVTRIDVVLKLTNHEDWVVGLVVGDIDYGCIVCPNSIRPNRVGQQMSDKLCAELILRRITDVVKLQVGEESVLRDMMLAILPHLI